MTGRNRRVEMGMRPACSTCQLALRGVSAPGKTIFYGFFSPKGIPSKNPVYAITKYCCTSCLHNLFPVTRGAQRACFRVCVLGRRLLADCFSSVFSFLWGTGGVTVCLFVFCSFVLFFAKVVYICGFQSSKRYGLRTLALSRY